MMNHKLNDRGDVLSILAACAVPINMWSFLLIASVMPQWLLRLTGWQVVGSVSYTLALTLLETLVVFGIAMALIFLLPRRFLGKVAVPLMAVFVVLTMALTVLIVITSFNKAPRLAIGAAVYVVLMLVSYFAITRNEKVAAIVNSIVVRLVPLAMLYLLFDVVAVLIVIVRNLFA